MLKIEIENLLGVLSQAKKNGCTNVKLHLYPDWETVQQEQKAPTHPLKDYQIDTRFYNSVEFETQIKDNTETDILETFTEGKTLIIRVSISDRESLLRGLGISEFIVEG